MILSRSPLRITFNGGGSDLPSYFNTHPGMCITAPIDRYVYITVHESFDGMYRIAYSEIENVRTVESIKHTLVRNTLKELGWSGPGLEITSVADVPSFGTGLGSSSAFTVALIRAIKAIRGESVTDLECARLATKIELGVSRSPIGLQDQYATSIADLVVQRFSYESVEVDSVFRDYDSNQFFLDELNKHLLFFHLNRARNANDILAAQSIRLAQDQEAHKLTTRLVALAEESFIAMRSHDFRELGKLLTLGWEIKSKLNGDSKDSFMQDLLEAVKTSSSFGGKLLGAGKGGFLMLLCHPSKINQVASEFSFLKRYQFHVTNRESNLLNFEGVRE